MPIKFKWWDTSELYLDKLYPYMEIKEETGIERYFREQKEKDWKLVLSNPEYKVVEDASN